MATNNTEYFVSLTDSDVQKKKSGKKNKIQKEKPKATMLWSWHFSWLQDLTQANFDSQ